MPTGRRPTRKPKLWKRLQLGGGEAGRLATSFDIKRNQGRPADEPGSTAVDPIRARCRAGVYDVGGSTTGLAGIRWRGTSPAVHSQHFHAYLQKVVV